MRAGLINCLPPSPFKIFGSATARGTTRVYSFPTSNAAFSLITTARNCSAPAFLGVRSADLKFPDDDDDAPRRKNREIRRQLLRSRHISDDAPISSDRRSAVTTCSQNYPFSASLREKQKKTRTLQPTRRRSELLPLLRAQTGNRSTTPALHSSLAAITGKRAAGLYSLGSAEH